MVQVLVQAIPWLGGGLARRMHSFLVSSKVMQAHSSKHSRPVPLLTARSERGRSDLVTDLKLCRHCTMNVYVLDDCDMHAHG